MSLCPLRTIRITHVELDTNFLECYKERCQWWWQCKEPENKIEIDSMPNVNVQAPEGHFVTEGYNPRKKINIK